MRRLLCTVLFLLLGSGSSRAAPPASRPQVRGPAAVASDHETASRIGLEVLREGGNAIDAACATALAVGVLHPQSNGVGGGSFMVVYLARPKKLLALDFRERAPGAATRDFFVRDGKVRPALAQRGALAIAVPGEIAGLAKAVREHGKLSFARCTAPAARLARGFPAHVPLVAALAGKRDYIQRFPEFARVFAPNGKHRFSSTWHSMPFIRPFGRRHRRCFLLEVIGCRRSGSRV